MNATFQIPLHAFSTVSQTVARLNKKAVKLGCPLIELSLCHGTQKQSTKQFFVREQGSSEVNPSGSTVVETVEIEVKFQTLLLNGWTPVCRIEHVRPSATSIDGPSKIENIVYPAPCHLPPAEIRESAKDREPVCEHCNVRRHRNETFIVYHPEKKQALQVGSTCLADFIGGTNADQALAAFSFMSTVVTTIFDECDFDGEKGAPYHRTAYDTQTALEVIAHVVRLHGYRSKKECQRGDIPTSQTVRELLRDHVWALRNYSQTVEQLSLMYLGLADPVRSPGNFHFLSQMNERDGWSPPKTAELLAPLRVRAEADLKEKAGRGERRIMLIGPTSAGCNQFLPIPLAISDADRLTADGCRRWVLDTKKDLVGFEGDLHPSGYMGDLLSVVANDLVSEAKLGLLTSAIPAYQKATVRGMRRQLFGKSVAVGKPEERLTIELRYVNSKFFPAQPQFGRGEVTLVEFTDATETNLFTWWTTSSIDAWKVEGLILAKATVKNHKEQDGVMTTNLGRVVKAPAPKAPAVKKPRKAKAAAA